VTAGEDGRPGGWVPSEPSSPAATGEQSAGDAETQPVTRASLRAAREADVRRHAQERVAAAGTADPAGATVAASPVTVVSAAALAVLLGLSAIAGSLPTALAVGFTAAVLVWGWTTLTDAPSPRTASAVVGAGVVGIIATAVVTRTEPYLVWVPAAVAVSVVGALLHQVLRAGGRPRLTEGVASSVAVLAVTASGAAMVALPREGRGGHWVAAAMTGVVVAAALLPLAHRPRMGAMVLVVTEVVGAGATVLAAVLLTDLPLLGTAILGILVTAVAHSLLRVLVALPAARTAPAAASVGAAAVLVVGVLVYLVARVYAG
jgi:hypothetical protein